MSNIEYGLKGYKVLDGDFTSNEFGNDYRVQIGNTYTMNFANFDFRENHREGFQFYTNLFDCYKDIKTGYYENNEQIYFAGNFHIVEIVALGETHLEKFLSKGYTTKIHIVGEVSRNYFQNFVSESHTALNNSQNSDESSNVFEIEKVDFIDVSELHNQYVTDWNINNFCSGCFMTDDKQFNMFNKQSSWSYSDWLSSDAREILEKYFGKHRVTYLWERNAWHISNQDLWEEIPDEDKQIILNMPNFDAAIFKEIMGIDVNENHI